MQRSPRLFRSPGPPGELWLSLATRPSCWDSKPSSESLCWLAIAARAAQALQRLREAQPQATALDALLDLSRLNVEPSAEPEPNGSTEWRIRRREGWLVPLPIGYAGLSELHAPGKVLNSRDNQTPVRFVESLYSMGEWVSPHRLTCLEQLLWHHNADPQSGIYRCTNRYTDYLTDAAEGIA